MKFAEVFRYELGHHLRSRSTWVYAGLTLAFAFAMIVDVGPVDAVNVNAPRLLAFNTVILGLFGIAITAAIFGEAALRDIDVGMDPIMFTLPVRKIEHLGGRFLAAFVANAVISLAVPLGFAVPVLIGYPDPSYFGPFRIAALIDPWLIFLLPNMAFAGAVLFTVAALSRRITVVYVSGFVVFMACMITGDKDLQGVIYDPAGIASLARATRDWTTSELNSRLVGATVIFVWNRLAWMAIAAGVFAFLHKRFQFAHADHSGRKKRRRESVDTARTTQARAVRVAPSFGFRTTVRQIFSIAHNSLNEITRNAWFVAILLVSAGWCATLVESTTLKPFDTTSWPVTMLVTTVLSRDFIVGVFMLVGFYANELVWKDRDAGISDIVDAAPVTENAAFSGRLIALIAIAAMLLTASIVGGMVGQIALDYYNFEPLLYVRAMLGLNLAKLALIAVLVMTVQVVVNHKHLGIFAMLFALAIPFTGATLKHYLLVYAGDAGWQYSDVNGFGPFLAPFMWLKLYSGGWAILLAVVACMMWVRGRESGMRGRLLQAHARFTGPLRRTTSFAFALIVVAGGFIFYNTNVLNAFDANQKRSESRSEYDKRYARFANVQQPTIERAQLRAEIYPGEQRVDLTGTLQLFNRTTAPIESIHVSSNRLNARSVSLSRSATLVFSDTAVGYRVYTLAQPLAPGDSIQLSFEAGFRQRGFPNSDFQTDVVDNGTYFGRGWLPFIGYKPTREQSDFDIRGEGKVRVDAIIGTSDDQIAITSGVLRRKWTENGRQYFHYETETPQPFEIPILSAKYAVRTDHWIDTSASAKRDVALSVYHHPGHDRNTNTFIRGMKASLAYYTENFGAYDASDFRIVEIPRYHREVRAHPNMIAFSEGRFIARTTDGQIDRVFFDTAYEIAQQWWGAQVRGALDVHDGDGTLFESLATYSALRVTEKEFGAEAAKRAYKSQLVRYAGQSASGPNAAVVSGMRQLLAMCVMRDHIGEQNVNRALRSLVDKHRAGVPPYPTALDLANALHAVTPDSLHQRLTGLFGPETVSNVKTDCVERKP